MSEGKRMTLGEMFAKREVEIKAELARQDAYEATPEGAAEKAEREAFQQKMREADERFALSHPQDFHAEGKSAALSGDPREAPDDLTDEQAEEWLDGWDSEGPDPEA